MSTISTFNAYTEELYTDCGNVEKFRTFVDASGKSIFFQSFIVEYTSIPVTGHICVKCHGNLEGDLPVK